MTVVTIYSLRNYEIVEKHVLEVDLPLRDVGYETIMSLISAAKRTSGLRGKSFILLFNGQTYYASRVGDNYSAIHLTTEE